MTVSIARVAARFISIMQKIACIITRLKKASYRLGKTNINKIGGLKPPIYLLYKFSHFKARKKIKRKVSYIIPMMR